MANFVEVQSSVSVQFFAADAGVVQQNLVANPLTVLANRSYNVADFAVCVLVGGGAGNPGVDQARINIDEYTTAGALVTALGTVPADNANANTWIRPASATITVAPAAATAALIGSATVARGNNLRISASSSGASVASNVRALGTLRVLPGNRYSATTLTTAYYANNTASGAQGSSATQSI
jgi:hypothetical protein